MSSSNISSLNLILQQVTIYAGIPILIVGLVGGLLNVIILLSLQTFRQSPCGFYLIIMSIVNIGQLVMSLLTRILISGFGIDWTQTSVLYCKIRVYCLHLCVLLSFTCMCLATIDQYMATCFRPRWQQYSNIKLARHLIIGFSFLWMFHEILSLVYYDLVMSTSTKQLTCRMTNDIFRQYYMYGYILILTGVLPICITVLFGLLAYRNVKQIPHRAVPFVRRELDKQLTAMVLVQVLFNTIVIVPYIIVTSLMEYSTTIKDLVTAAELNTISLLTGYFYYLYFASPFYIYVAVSQRFRRQLIHVLFEIHLNRNRMVVYPIIP